MVSDADVRTREADFQAGPHGERAVKEFDLITVPARQRLEVSHASVGDIPALLERAQVAIGISLARKDIVARIARENPDCLWAFRRRGRVVGGFAMLMLNEPGLAALLSDRLDLADPPPSLLVPCGERPAAVYVWAVLGASVASEGIARVIVHLQQYPYNFSDIFAAPATEDGLRFMRGLGLHPVSGHPRALHRYVRLVNRPPPIMGG